MAKSLRHLILIFYCSMLFLFSINSFANDLYRADARTPQEIRRAGGLLPRGTYDAYERGTPQNINLFDHANGTPSGNTRYDDGYVSTTYTLAAAHTIGQNILGGLNEYYIYVITPAPNIFDVNGVLGRYSPHPYEHEYAALGGVPISQVIGWYRVSFGVIQGNMTRNSLYRPDLFRGMNIAPNDDGYRLAGFPSGHQAWGESPWREHAVAQCRSELRSGSSKTCHDQINVISKGEFDHYKINLRKSNTINLFNIFSEYHVPQKILREEL
ncbi:enterotoxin A family protein [Yersinia enterocolitica]|uniref:enterotoxin A family protein n=1 Tax=Yersinia enterocolitica TaxID=630 RepID=UPI001C8D2DA8|nr:enterotoxin A family protein [Yersinia enterocolitica]MBX9477489.1 enterotoxin A family protein [Yersinia enterocolitica]